MLEIAEAYNRKSDRREENEEVDLLLNYLKCLIKYKDKEIISIIKEIDEQVAFYERELEYTTTLK